MLSLIKKEFSINKSIILTVLLIFPISYFLQLPAILFYYVFVFTIVFSSFHYDYQVKAERRIASMPITRKEIVAARYIFGFIVSLLIFIYVFLFNWIALQFFTFEEHEPMGLSSILTYFCAILIFNAVSYPLYYKFSYYKAFVMHIILILIVTSLLVPADMLLNGKGILSKFADSYMDHPYLYTILLTIAATVFSFIISTKVYSKKDL